MGALLFLFGAALAAGLYFVLADLLKIPRLATERALISAGRRERSLVKSLEALILGWALKLAPLIRMDEYKYRRLENKLTAAGLDMTPQVYTAYSLLKPCLILLGIIPCLLILPILSPLIVVLAVLTWFKESRRADELVKARMELIEGELPRFVATIHQELAASRDVLRILENYKKHAGPDFGRELDVLTADMRSSSYEAALIRFEARMGSAIISDIVRGLIGILRGDDGRMYFQMLSHDLKAQELQRLKAKAQNPAQNPNIQLYHARVLHDDLHRHHRVPDRQLPGEPVLKEVTMRKLLKRRSGEGYIDVCVLVVCAMLVLALVVRVLPVYITKQQLDTYAVELVREAEIAGQVGTETTRRAAALTDSTGLDPDIRWSTTGRIQLNDEVTVTLTLETDIGLFGGLGSFPITLTAEATGKSEVYWK